MLSGNNFAKIKRMADFFGLHFLSKSTYYRLQRLYLLPEIDDWWCWMREELLKEFEGQDTILGGDGQCDSPGFNAKNLCYFLVEVNTGYILNIEILDKRHVGLISTNMEKEAIRRGLLKVTKELKVVELVTHESTSIKALMSKFLQSKCCTVVTYPLNLVIKVKTAYGAIHVQQKLSIYCRS